MDAVSTNNYQGTGICQFTLEDYVLPPRVEQSINRVVQRLVSQHEAAFGFKARPDFRLHMRIFGRFEDYARFIADHKVRVPGINAGNLTNLAGFYSEQTKELVTWRQHIGGTFGNVLLHESSHAIMHAHFLRTPQWLLEGCAEYFAYPPDMQDSKDVQMLRIRWGLLSLWLGDGNLTPLRSFLNLSHADWNEQDLDRAYTVSWSLCQFLMRSEPSRAMLGRWLREIQLQRDSDIDTVKLIERDCPGGLKQFESSWHNWIAEMGRKLFPPAALNQLRELDRQREREQAPHKP
jgi:hypothetical protein